MEYSNWYERIGLKVGLEVHQQLDVGRKLFCHCPVRHKAEGVLDEFERRLRPTRSELGEIDVAAYFEWKRGRVYRYTAPRASSCLVEADEEPPHELNVEALKVALAFAKAVGAVPVDEVHVMRKIVIDGSNTTGFQRTALIALGGAVKVGGKKVRIQTICVEEDSARKVKEENQSAFYDLERLGVPLIEVSTAPDVSSPEEALQVALTIGLMLRLTGKAKRGIGTVRQDLNISVMNGPKVEVKGVQELELLPLVIRNEVSRQLRLLEIRDEMVRRGIRKEDLLPRTVDVTRVLAGSRSRLVKRLLSRPGSVALASCVPKVRGLLGVELQPGRRFGTEVSDYASFWSGVGGILHSDELPGYEITREEVEELRRELGCGEEDAFVLVIDEATKAERGLRYAFERIAMALEGVPPETRAAMPDGTTRYMRPLPGSARMYPETDIPPIRVTEEMLKEAEAMAPPTPEEAIRELTEGLGLSAELAREAIFDELYPLFLEVIRSLPRGEHVRLLAWAMVQLRRSLKREGVPVERLREEHYRRMAEKMAKGELTKEGVEQLMRLLAENPQLTVDEAMERLGLSALSDEELREVVRRVIEENRKAVEERGEKAFGLIMGRVMEVLRGRAPGRKVSTLVKEVLAEFLAGGKRSYSV